MTITYSVLGSCESLEGLEARSKYFFWPSKNLYKQCVWIRFFRQRGNQGKPRYPFQPLNKQTNKKCSLKTCFTPMCDCTKGAIDHFSSIWWLQIQHALFEQTTAEKSAVSNSRACLVFFQLLHICSEIVNIIHF